MPSRAFFTILDAFRSLERSSLPWMPSASARTRNLSYSLRCHDTASTRTLIVPGPLLAQLANTNRVFFAPYKFVEKMEQKLTREDLTKSISTS